MYLFIPSLLALKEEAICRYFSLRSGVRSPVLVSLQNKRTARIIFNKSSCTRFFKSRPFKKKSSMFGRGVVESESIVFGAPCATLCHNSCRCQARVARSGDENPSLFGMCILTGDQLPFPPLRLRCRPS